MVNGEIRLEVLRVSQPIGDFFISSIQAKDLVEISYSDVRRLASEERDIEKYMGVQRPIDKRRIKQIKKYIEGSDATFPTAVIVAIDEKCAEFISNDNGRFGTLVLRPYFNVDNLEENIPIDRIAKVLDGQHRIAAFLNEDQNWTFDFDMKPFDINLSIFIGADLSEQANIFATVNLAQTKVNKSLAYDLTELANSKSPYKTCHNVAVALDSLTSSPLYKRIKRLGTATEGRQYEPLTQAAFVEALVHFISSDPVTDRNRLLDGYKLKYVNGQELRKTPFRNLFIDDNEGVIAGVLYNWFTAIRLKWPNSWDALEKTGNLLPKSNAFKAFMKYLRVDILPHFILNDQLIIPEIINLQKYLDNANISDRDFTIQNFAPGSGGESKFLQLLRGKISMEDLIVKN